MRPRTRHLVIGLSAIAVAMFFFSYALIPLYNVLCKQLGLNGKVALQSSAPGNPGTTNRTVRVQFLATNNANLPWTFYPKVKQLEIHPGENIKFAYFAQNNSGHTMTVQAIPSVTPGLAANHLKKTECFCFRQQTLHAHQSTWLPLLFHVDPTLPNNINEITLSYTLFDTAKISSPSRKPQGRL